MATTDILTYVRSTEQTDKKNFTHFTLSDGNVISSVVTYNPQGKMVTRWLLNGSKTSAQFARKVLESAVDAAEVKREETYEDLDPVFEESDYSDEDHSAALAVLEERHPVADNPAPVLDQGIYYSDIPFKRANVAGIFWDRLGKYGSRELMATRHPDVRVGFDNRDKMISLFGKSESEVFAASEDLLTMFDEASAVYKDWKKSNEEYKALNQSTKEGRQGSYRLTRDFWTGYVQQFLTADLI